ncbi:FAD-dependent oxidoreductase [Streptomyces sp. NPDC057433]|uniref:FAD-dependent oxidoreductase n=1 Tax=Streptomyces sp. NPDC057433 TaxID=3346132 RepID=UPI003681C4C2
MRISEGLHSQGEIPESCSVLVLGAGMSGLSTALELGERGVRDIVVADPGPFTGFEHRSRTPNTVPLPHAPSWWRSASPHYAELPGVTGPLGGRSRCWHGVLLPMSRRVLERHWPNDTTDRLLAGGPGSYRAVMRELLEWQRASDGPRPDRTLDDPREELKAIWPDLSLETVPQAGWSVDGPDGRLVWAYSPLMAWARRGLARHVGLDLPRVVSGLRAISVQVEAGSVRGVLLATPDGGVREVRADVVVLAAGTLENTRLYAQALAEVGDTVTRWPGLNDHVSHGYAIPLPSVLAERWTRSDHRFLRSDHEDELNANLFMEVHAAGLAAPVLDLWWMAQQEEPFHDEIRFDPPNRAASGGNTAWAGQVTASFSSADEEKISRRDEITGKLLEALNVGVAEERGFVDFEPAAQAALATGTAHHYVSRLGTTDHEAGTVPLGRRLDFGGRSLSVGNLFVAGPATFPTSGAANPSLTILALAAHTAEAVTGDRGNPSP